MDFPLSVAAAARLRISLRRWLAAWRSYRQIYHPFVDLGIRIAIAQSFLHAAMMTAMDRPGAIDLVLFADPARYMSADTAALTALTIALICPVLLMLGLFTRIAALPLAMLVLIAQASGPALDANLFQAAILTGYIVFGARGLSLDALITPGLRDSALPVIPRIIRWAGLLTGRAGPWFQLALRLWIGWALIGLPGSAALFPLATIQTLLPMPIAMAGGLLLAFGLGTSVINKLLVVALLSAQMMMTDEPNSLWLILLLAQIGLIGAGRWSLDDRIHTALIAWMEPRHGTRDAQDWPRVVIVGAGFGGLACAAKLRHLPVHLTIVDRHNYHLFQPLLYQVATAGLSPADIASPIRSQFRDDPNVHVIMRAVTGIDPGARRVIMGDQTLPYDLLVIATGATHSYFGRDEWAAFAPGLKRVDDATAVRARLLLAFERAENAASEDEGIALLTFIIVGAGPTGVELAGAIAELARFGLAREFRRIEPATARVILVQSGPRILPAFPETLSLRAGRSLGALGVDIRVNSRVEAIDGEGVMIGGMRVRAGTVLWAAGVTASPAAHWLGVKPDAAGRVPVDDHLRVVGQPDIFAIGDTAASLGWGGRAVPGLAPAAKQGGEHVARMVRARLEMRSTPAPFRYRHQGSLATIGRKAAVADFGRLRLWGAPAWWLWGMVHVLFLSGLRNRIAVVTAWIWAYITFRSGTRLITGPEIISGH